MDTIVTYTAMLDVRDGTVFFLARLLWLRRRELGTRRGRRNVAPLGHGGLDRSREGAWA